MKLKYDDLTDQQIQEINRLKGLGYKPHLIAIRTKIDVDLINDVIDYRVKHNYQISQERREHRIIDIERKLLWRKQRREQKIIENRINEIQSKLDANRFVLPIDTVTDIQFLLDEVNRLRKIPMYVYA